MGNQQGHTVEPIEPCYVAAWMGAQSGGEWIHTDRCMTESLCCPAKIVTPMLISYTTKKNYLWNW